MSVNSGQPQLVTAHTETKFRWQEGGNIYALSRNREGIFEISPNGERRFLPKLASDRNVDLPIPANYRKSVTYPTPSGEYISYVPNLPKDVTLEISSVEQRLWFGSNNKAKKASGLSLSARIRFAQQGKPTARDGGEDASWFQVDDLVVVVFEKDERVEFFLIDPIPGMPGKRAQLKQIHVNANIFYLGDFL